MRRWIRSLRCDRLAKDQPAEMTMFQISEVQESPVFDGRRSFLTLREFFDPTTRECPRRASRRRRGDSGRRLLLRHRRRGCERRRSRNRRRAQSPPWRSIPSADSGGRVSVYHAAMFVTDLIKSVVDQESILRAVHALSIRGRHRTTFPADSPWLQSAKPVFWLPTSRALTLPTQATPSPMEFRTFTPAFSSSFIAPSI